MDISFCSSLPVLQSSFLFDCESLPDNFCDAPAFDAASDTGYFSAGSSLSPTSSVDSFCLSPHSIQAVGNERSSSDYLIVDPPAASHLTHNTQFLPYSRYSAAASTTKKSRSRYPGKKRQTASEREKLRMRDLTKAMHHLRTYLPPSLAPTGQTLTKIETLRLTIRYISYLSAHLGISEEALEQRRSSAFVEKPQTLSQYLGQPVTSHSTQESVCSTLNTTQLCYVQPPHQVSGGASFTSIQHWMPRQPQHASLSGHC